MTTNSGQIGTWGKLDIIGTDNYAEVGGYDPVEIGYMVVKIRGGKLVDIEKKVI